MVTSPIPGVSVGHHTDAEARTGCTVIRLPDGTVASGEVRGGAPATREFELLDPQRRVDRLDAVVLCGGSAFGLAAADGVMAHLADEGIGFATRAGAVPIVVAMSVFDLGVGDGSVRPTADHGRQAAAAAGTEFDVGTVGAGAGATLGNWAGPEAAEPGGIGWASVTHGGVTVAALVVVNAIGRALTAEDPIARATATIDAWADLDEGRNTTIGVVLTDATLIKSECQLVAQSGHDGLARALEPAHTRYDGDALVVAATGSVDADTDHVRVLAAGVVESAVRHVGAR
ncbi:MAG: P1 family peptidase [Acidimicrobiia bacterium]|nr:P1 family peptidase [Acidimicrobiia bacterium]